jgi:hypothetical protein
MVLIENQEYLTEEEKRLKQDRERTAYWKRWGPYVAERQWATGNTVRSFLPCTRLTSSQSAKITREYPRCQSYSTLLTNFRSHDGDAWSREYSRSVHCAITNCYRLHTRHGTVPRLPMGRGRYCWCVRLPRLAEHRLCFLEREGVCPHQCKLSVRY